MEYKEEIKMTGWKMGERGEGRREERKRVEGKGREKETRGEAGQGRKQGERGSVRCAGMLE